jgi:TolB-like protein
LPFENASGDPAQDGLAAQMTHLLTAEIAAGRDGPVIPEMTAATYRGNVVDLAAIGRQHDVHFVLVGNARRQNERLIVSATLYETAGGRSVWSEQLDHPDTAEGERSIVQSIYESVWQYSVDEEGARAKREHPNSLDKRDLLNMALSTEMATPTKAHKQEQIALIERALALDPNDFVLLERQARLLRIW